MLRWSGKLIIELFDDVTVMFVSTRARAGLPLLSCSWITRIGRLLANWNVDDPEGVIGATYAASFDGAGITVVTVTLPGKREEEVTVMLDWP
jgi:hypothetical protein